MVEGEGSQFRTTPEHEPKPVKQPNVFGGTTSDSRGVQISGNDKGSSTPWNWRACQDRPGLAGATWRCRGVSWTAGWTTARSLPPSECQKAREGSPKHLVALVSR
jgi:hypothetical protein